MKNEIINLVNIMGNGSFNGTIPLAAVAGLFSGDNALMLAMTFISGPGAIVTSVMMEGVAKERMLAALLAGIIATIMIVLSAGFGPSLLGFVNVKILRVTGAISVGFIALIIGGVKIPSNLPLIIIILGIVVGGIVR